MWPEKVRKRDEEESEGKEAEGFVDGEAAEVLLLS